MPIKKQSNKRISFAIDGSSNALSMAFFENKKLIGQIFIEEALHSKTIVSNFNNLMEELGLQISDISSLYFTNGPGRYTSLRIVLSTLKGLFFDFRGEAYCINSADLIASNYQGKSKYFSIRFRQYEGEILYYYENLSKVKRLFNQLLEECEEFKSVPDVKNLFRIDKAVFNQCQLTDVKLLY